MKTSLPLILLLIVLGYSGMAQTKVSLEPADRITMLNGEEKTGKVTEIADDSYKFVHQGETLVYTLKKNLINKVQFSSGRIEFVTLTPVAPSDQSSEGLRTYQNKVAVLPFIYIVDIPKGEKMEFRVQSECYDLLKQNAAQLSIQDPAITNALIAKQGITETNYTGYTPGEVADILGVEYIVMGSVTVQSVSAIVSENKKGAKTAAPINIPAATQYSAKVDLRVYDRGQMLFSQAHTAYWRTPESYVLSLKYLLKRTPVFKK